MSSSLFCWNKWGFCVFYGEMECIEREVPFSESLLWRLQRNAYIEYGPECWIQKRVPFHVTSNAYIAQQYAELVLANLPKEGSIYFLELGGGSGKFAYLFLNAIMARMDRPFCYVLTDLAEKNISYWKQHPLLKPFVEKGVLDFAVYDPLQPSPPKLEVRGGNLSNPRFIIANYFFDSIEADLFRVEAGTLLEGKISLFAKEKDIDLNYPDSLSHIQEKYSYHPVKDKYGIAEWNEILEEHRTHLDKTSFLFPTGAFKVVQNLISFSELPFVMLAGDKGFCSLAEFPQVSDPGIDFHSTISFPVNFYAIAEYMKKMKGNVVHRSVPCPLYSVNLFYSGEKNPGIERSYRELFDPFNSIELFYCADLVKKNASREKLLSFLDGVHWDADIFFSLNQQHELLEQADWPGVIERLKRTFFPLCREDAFPLSLLAAFLESRGVSVEALNEYNLFLQSLPTAENCEERSLRAFIDTIKPTKNVLQIGGSPSAVEAILAHNPKSHTLIPSSLEELDQAGVFDEIFYFAPHRPLRPQKKGASILVEEGKKMIQAIEQKYPFLKEIIYTDADIEFFFQTQNIQEDPRRFLYFFFELEKRKQITRTQLEQIAARFEKQVSKTALAQFLTEREAAQEEDLFSEIVLRCLKCHMKEGAILRAYLPHASSKFEDERLFNEAIANPYVDYKEEPCPISKESQVLWVTINKCSRS